MAWPLGAALPRNTTAGLGLGSAQSCLDRSSQPVPAPRFSTKHVCPCAGLRGRLLGGSPCAQPQAPSVSPPRPKEAHHSGGAGGGGVTHTQVRGRGGTRHRLPGAPTSACAVLGPQVQSSLVCPRWGQGGDHGAEGRRLGGPPYHRPTQHQCRPCPRSLPPPLLSLPAPSPHLPPGRHLRRGLSSKQNPSETGSREDRGSGTASAGGAAGGGGRGGDTRSRGGGQV